MFTMEMEWMEEDVGHVVCVRKVLWPLKITASAVIKVQLDSFEGLMADSGEPRKWLLKWL